MAEPKFYNWLRLIVAACVPIGVSVATAGVVWVMKVDRTLTSIDVRMSSMERKVDRMDRRDIRGEKDTWGKAENIHQALGGVGFMGLRDGL